MMTRTTVRRLAIGVFMAALVAPAVAAGASNQVRATLSTVITQPAAWPEQSNRLRQATPLWNNAVGTYAGLMYRLGASPQEGVAVAGRDGWMFLGDVQNANFSQALGRRQYSPGEIDAWAATVRLQSQWLANRGIPMLFVVGPAKWSVYEDKMPEWSDGSRQDTIFDQVRQAYPDLPLVDLRDDLREAREVADTYSPLNSHWTDYGAYVGWQALADEIEAAAPGLAPVFVPELESVRTEDLANEFEGMINLRAENPWTVPVLSEPLPDVDIVGADGTTTPLTGGAKTGLLDMPRTTVNPDAPNDATVLVLRDSMGDALSPYLQAAFGRTVQVRHNIDNSAETPNLPALVDMVQPDLVIYEMAERHFNSGLADLGQWFSANDFDSADPGSELRWESSAPGAAGLTVDGPPDLSTPTQIAWSDASGDDRARVLRISLVAEAPGILTVRTADGSEVPLRYGRDANVLFATLPAGPATDAVSVSRSDGSGAVTLTSVAVRSAGPAEPTTNEDEDSES